MSYFSNLFKDKFNSPLVREYIEKIIREMAELKHKNYNEMQIINQREKEIKKIQEALVDLGIEVDENFDPELIDDEEWR
jgi:DNA-binding protein H-NS